MPVRLILFIHLNLDTFHQEQKLEEKCHNEAQEYPIKNSAVGIRYELLNHDLIRVVSEFVDLIEHHSTYKSLQNQNQFDCSDDFFDS